MLAKEDFFLGGFLSSGYTNFSPKTAFQKSAQEDVIFLDVRERKLTAYKQFMVPRTLFIPLSELKERIQELSYDKGYIVADSVGLRSREAMNILSVYGFQFIANLAGGIVEWERDGLPLVVNKNEQLDGSCVCQLRPRFRLRG